MFNRLAKPEDQPEFKQGYEAYFQNKEKSENPYKNWLRKGAEMKKIYWDMGWEEGNNQR